MKAYADTGFVVSLYKRETTTPAAALAMSRLQPPVYLSELCRLEFHNALQLAVFRGELEPAAADRKKQVFLDDLRRGVFTVVAIPVVAVYARAIELAERHTAGLGTRSLDLLHVAGALCLEVDVFLGFDQRQRQVAQAEGLEVRP
jgi:predicted nucleic acid-binding protein